MPSETLLLHNLSAAIPYPTSKGATVFDLISGQSALKKIGGIFFFSKVKYKV